MSAKDNKKAEDKVFIIETPVENFCGIGAAGLQFAYGKAECREGWVLDWYREHGYKVTEKVTEKDADITSDKA